MSAPRKPDRLILLGVDPGVSNAAVVAVLRREPGRHVLVIDAMTEWPLAPAFEMPDLLIDPAYKPPFQPHPREAELERAAAGAGPKYWRRRLAWMQRRGAR